MSVRPLPRRQHRTADLLNQATRDFPNAWTLLDRLRADRIALGDWPAWCFLPMAAHYAVVSRLTGHGATISPARIGDVARLAALGTWRYTQGIYRLDPELHAYVADTPLEQHMPCDVLFRFPEWCIYIETPGQTWYQLTLHGFFAHLEHDMETRRTELRLLMDTESGLLPVPLHLGDWPLSEAVQRFVSAACRNVPALVGTASMSGSLLVETLTREMSVPINYLLFVLSQAQDIGQESRRPGNPAPTKTKKGWRLFPASAPAIWDVGVWMGSALRHARELREHSSPSSVESSSIRPHIRRAHWHGYWIGPKQPEQAQARRLDLRWLPPIAVNLNDMGQLRPTIRPVRVQ